MENKLITSQTRQNSDHGLPPFRQSTWHSEVSQCVRHKAEPAMNVRVLVQVGWLFGNPLIPL